MKHILSKLTLMSCAISGAVGLAHAEEGRLLEFTYIDRVQDIACVVPDGYSLDSKALYPRTVSYQITNFGPTHVELNLELENNDNFPANLFTFSDVECASGPFIGGATQVPASLDSGESCDIELLITPPDCPVINFLDPEDPDAAFGPLNGPINRVFEIDIDTRQVDLSTQILAKLSTLGAAAEFGALGCEISNDDDDGPAQVDNGDAGAGELDGYSCTTDKTNSVDPSGIFGEVQVINGIKYLEFNAQPTQYALQDLNEALDMFYTEYYNMPCIFPQSTNTDPDDLSGVILGPNRYCLDGQYVPDVQTLTLSGRGQYVFFVAGCTEQRDLSNSSKAAGNGCGFYLGENATVVWGQGARVDDIFWVELYPRAILLDTASTLAGNLISYRYLRNSYDGNNFQVNGRMLSLEQVYLDGTSITVK